jgi:hypothetical protein
MVLPSQLLTKAAEKKLNGPYTGGSERTQRRKDKKLRDKEELDVISRDRYQYFTAQPHNF